MNIDQAKKMLLVDEGLRLKPYRCTAGKTSIGYGRNLDDVGISQREDL
jgi:lysozyme